MDKLTQLFHLANLLSEAERATEFADKALKKAKENERRLREESIPLFMLEIEAKELTLQNGDKVSVKSDVYASVPEANKQAVFSWLEKHEFDGIIKTEVAVQFGKGEIDKAKALMARIMENEDEGLVPTLSESVHPQTLKAFLREQIAKGTDIPLDLFGARPVEVAKITRGNRKL